MSIVIVIRVDFFFPEGFTVWNKTWSFTNTFSSRSKPDPPLVRFHSARLPLSTSHRCSWSNRVVFSYAGCKAWKKTLRQKKKWYDLIKWDNRKELDFWVWNDRENEVYYCWQETSWVKFRCYAKDRKLDGFGGNLVKGSFKAKIIRMLNQCRYCEHRKRDLTAVFKYQGY